MPRWPAGLGGRRSGTGQKPGAMLIIGLLISSVLDPRTKPAVEEQDRNKAARRTGPGRENT